MKDYISVQEASNKWGVSERQVNHDCTEGRISGLSRFGLAWCTHADAEKPADFRKPARNGGNSYA